MRAHGVGEADDFAGWGQFKAAEGVELFARGRMEPVFADHDAAGIGVDGNGPDVAGIFSDTGLTPFFRQGIGFAGHGPGIFDRRGIGWGDAR